MEANENKEQVEESKIVGVGTKVASSISSFRPTKLEIFLFIAVAALVIFLVFFRTDTKSDENKRLTSEINQIKKQKDSVVNNINILQSQYKLLQASDSLGKQKLVLIDQKLNKISQDLSYSIGNLDKQRIQLDSINNKIKLSISSPVIRKGDDLINSLKSKLN